MLSDSNTVLIAGYFDPPVMQRNEITTPHSWASNAQEKLLDSPIWKNQGGGAKRLNKQTSSASIVGAGWDKIGGLIAVVELPVLMVINEFEVPNFDKEYTLSYNFKLGCFCSFLEYDPKFIKKGKVEILNNATPFGLCLERLDGGCNKAGAVIAPTATKFNDLWHRSRSRILSPSQRKIFAKRPKLNSDTIVKMFPHLDWSKNNMLKQIGEISAINK